MAKQTVRHHLAKKTELLQAVELLQLFDVYLTRLHERPQRDSVVSSFRRLHRGRSALEKKIATAWLGKIEKC